MPNIVYVLTNPVMEGLVKIGMTDDLQSRLKQLSSHSGVPLPFECAIAWEVDGVDALEVEKALHTAFEPDRVTSAREFFRIDPDQPGAILRVMPGRDVTPDQVDASEEEKKAAATHSKTNEREFMESLNENGIVVYERVLPLQHQRDMKVKWGRKGFSLNVAANHKNIGVCWGFPPSFNNQAIDTGLSVIRDKSNVPEDTLNALRQSALDTKLFEPIGEKGDLRFQTDRRLDETQLDALTGWLRKVITTVREAEGLSIGD